MSTPPSVLLWNPAPSPLLGGHRVQMEMTAKFLEARGDLRVRVSTDLEPDLDGVDVVHGFELETSHVRQARVRRIPVCLSTIYGTRAWRTGELVQRPPVARLRHRGRMAAVLAGAALQGRHMAKSEAFASYVREKTALYECVDLLLPNSALEAAAMVADLGVSTPTHVVPNGVDPESFPGGLPWSERRGVLYVGRLEPHKNQLTLIRALRGTGLTLTIVGGDHPHHPGYGDLCRAEADSTVTMLPALDHASLADVYARAKVHALPSHYETTGLVSLEAALAGCNVVSTSVGFAREYLTDLAWYCDPYDLGSVRGAVVAAHEAPHQAGLAPRVRERYTWQHTAQATAEAYLRLLA